MWITVGYDGVGLRVRFDTWGVLNGSRGRSLWWETRRETVINLALGWLLAHALATEYEIPEPESGPFDWLPTLTGCQH